MGTAAGFEPVDFPPEQCSKRHRNPLLNLSTVFRDAAVDLVGKHMIDSPVVARDYHSRVAERVADTGLAICKCDIRRLKSFYEVSDKTGHRIDVVRNGQCFSSKRIPALRNRQ